MKLRLPSALLLAVLACHAASAASYVADGVLLGYEAESDRFYDNGKGYYWPWKNSTPNTGAKTLFDRTGGWKFLGDLAPRISGTAFTTTAFSRLVNDGYTCWYNTSANVIQYWESYYGVFYNGTRELPYGYTYSKEYVPMLGGTQSLKVDMAFYDNMKNDGGHLLAATRWYLAGNDDANFVRTQGNGGYFADYFTSADCCTYLAFSNSGTYSNYRPYGLDSLETELVKGLHLKQDADGNMVPVQVGQLVYLGLMSDTQSGHAITCYGIETAADSRLKALYVTNSDDREYSLLTLYVKEAADGRVFLYTDEACTQYWQYSDCKWFVSGMEYINTPQLLMDMYESYTDSSNPLVWNGRGTEGWTSAYTPATTEKLPTASTGWDVSVHDAFYHSYYQENRPVVFDDTAYSSTVKVTGEITVPELRLENVGLNYTFNGQNAVLYAPLSISGKGSAVFKGVTINTGTLEYQHYTLGLGTGAVLRAGNVHVGWSGSLKLQGGSAVLNSLTLGKRAALEVEGSGILTVGQLVMENGSDLHLRISSANVSSPLLSFTGTLTLGDEVNLSVDGSGLVDGKKYRLITMTNGYAGSLPDDLHCYSGTLTYSGNTLYLTYHAMGAYTWSKGSGTWGDGAWNGSALNTAGTAVTFTSLGSGTVTVNGQVTPYSMGISGGSYTFVPGTEDADINVLHDLTLSGSSKVVTSVPLDPRCLYLKDKASLTFNLSGVHRIEEICTAAGTQLIFSGGTYFVDGVVEMDGSLSVKDNTVVTLDADRDLVINGAVSTAASSSLILSSEHHPVHYSLKQGLKNILGSLVLGGGSGKVSLRVDGDMSTTVSLLPNAVLELHDKGTFSAAAGGTGTISVAACGDQSFALNNNLLTFAPTLALAVDGTAQIGSEKNALIGSLSDNVSISGTLTVYFNHLLKAKTEAHVLKVPNLTLDHGGVLSIVSVPVETLTTASCDFYHAPTNIGSLTVGAGGGTILRTPADGSSFIVNSEIMGYAAPISIGRLSGSGDLTLQGAGYYTTTLYRLENPGAYTGDLTVENLASRSGTTANSYNMVALELGKAVLPGSVVLQTTAGAYERCKAVIGLMDDVTIGGLDSVGNGSFCLYSGRLGGLLHSENRGEYRQSTDVPLADMLTDVSHRTLTIDTASNHRFSGSVLSDISIRKSGSGLQVFDGDMSCFSGVIAVTGGHLKFYDNINAIAVMQWGGTRLDVGGALHAEEILNLHSAELSAASITAGNAVFSGSNRVSTNSLSGSSVWVFGLTLENMDAPILSLESLSGRGSLSLKSLCIEFDSTQLATASYKLLEYSSDFGGKLSKIAISGGCSATSIGEKGKSDVYYTTSLVNGKTVYTLMVDVAHGGVIPPRDTPTSLTWQKDDGVWGVSVGHEEESWAGTVSNRHFLNGDSVEFHTAAMVTVQGTVVPSEVKVNHNRGTVELKGSGCISGKGGLYKEGAGTLSISTANSYSGGTTISGGNVNIGHAKALGTGSVQLEDGVLAMGNAAVANTIVARGGTLSGTAYKGALTVDGNVRVGAGFHANKLTLQSGVLTGDVSSSAVKQLISSGGGIDGNLTLDGGALTLGSRPLCVSGHVLLKASTTLDLSAFKTEGCFTLIEAALLDGDVSLLSYKMPSDMFGYALETANGALLLNVKRLAATQTCTTSTAEWKEHSSLGSGTYETGDWTVFATPASVTISGNVTPGGILVDSIGNVKFITNKKELGSGIGGAASLTKSGTGVLTLNSGNTYNGGTVLNAGTIKATAVDSFGSGIITVYGGTLDFGGKAVANDVVLSGSATIKNDAKYAGSVTVQGDATLLAKTAYKGLTTIGSGSSLTLAAAAAMAGNIALNGGRFNISAVKGMTLGKNQRFTLNSGTVGGILNIGAGSTLVWKNGTFATAPVLKGGTVDLGGAGTLALTSTNGAVSIANRNFTLLAKSYINSDESFTVKSGTVTVNSFGGSAIDAVVSGGMLKIATGTVATNNAIIVNGNAAVVNGSTHYGNITVNGTLAKGTVIKLLDERQSVTLSGSGIMLGTISGKGLTVVNGDVDITSAKLTNANILLCHTLTHAKGWTLAKGQTLTLAGGSVNGTLNIGSGAVLDMNGHTLEEAPVLKGGTAMFGGSCTLTLTSKSGNINIDGQDFALKAKSYINSGKALAVNGGTVTINSFGGSKKEVIVNGGTLKIATGTIATNNSVIVDGNAAVVNGSAHYGNITVNGNLAKGTVIKLLDERQTLTLNGAGPLLGSISGKGSVLVNESLNATGATLKAANVYLNKGTFTKTNGFTLAAGQTLTLAGASLDLGIKALATVAGSTLRVNRSASITGNLTLGGGTLVFAGGALDVSGTLTLSKAMTVTGSGIITYNTLKAAANVDVVKLFGEDAVLDRVNGTLTFGTPLPQTTMCLDTPEPETAAATLSSQPEPLSESGEEALETEDSPALATAAEEEQAERKERTAVPLPRMNPAADALVQSAWALVDTTRAFTGSIRNRSMGTLTQDGKGAVWANAIGSFARRGSVNGHSGSQVNVYGGSFGAEHTMGEHHTVGVALGSTHALVGGTAISKLRQDATHVAVYGNSRMGSKFSADWAAAFGSALMHGNMGAARAKWNQNSGELTARVNYTETLSDRTALRAYAGLDYDTTGADRVNGYKAGSAQALRGELGVGFTHASESAVLYAEVGMVGDMVRHNPTVDCVTYRVQGANPGRMGFKATVGGSVKLNERWSANAAYNIETAADSTQQSVNVGVSRKF